MTKRVTRTKRVSQQEYLKSVSNRENKVFRQTFEHKKRCKKLKGGQCNCHPEEFIEHIWTEEAEE